MWRKRLAKGLYVVAAVLIGFLSVVVARAGWTEDALVGAMVLGLVPMAILLAGWLLNRGANRRVDVKLSWVPDSDRWLPQQSWQDLPDPLPARPRPLRRRPMPAVGVPPDETLRRLWAVRAELAYNRRSPFAVLPISGRLGALATLPLVVFSIAFVSIAVERYQAGEPIAAGLFLTEWSLCLAVAAAMSWWRPLRRHAGLVKLERQIDASTRLRHDAGVPLPERGMLSAVTDPRTGYRGFYHPQLTG